MALVTSGEQFLDRDRLGVTAQTPDPGDRLVDLGLPARDFGYQSGNGPAMAGDHHCLAALNIIEQLRQMGLGIGGLDFAH
jgi:hypothetical protein